MAELNTKAAVRWVPDAWLAEILERPSLRLAVTDADATQLSQEMTAFSRDGDAFFYAKLPTSEVAACIGLTAAGFAVVDTALTLSWAGAAPAGAAAAVRVAQARRDQQDAIVAIAGSCFRWSRFHLDPQLPVRMANLVKRRWVENYVNGSRGSALYAAELDATVAGFLAVIESTLNGTAVATIDLVGVATQFQGRGVGAALVDTFLREWQPRARELRVGTQAANVRSLRLYESRGFRVAESSYVLHAHYHGGRIRR